MDCVFCSIAAANDPHHEIVWEDDAHVAFLNARPAMPHSILVIPRQHIDYAFDLDADAFGALMEASRKLAIPLKDYAKAVRTTLAIDGFHIAHAHVHLIPALKSGDMCTPAGTPSPEELRVAGNDLRTLYADFI